MRSKWLLWPLLLGLLLPAGASAVTLPLLSPTGFGLLEFFGCPDGTPGCLPTSNTFDLTGLPPATGSLTITDPIIVFTPTAAMITLTLPSATVTTSPAVNGVDEIVFTDLVYTASFMMFPQIDGSNWDLAGGGISFSLTGDYEQFLAGGSVAGPASVPASVQGSVSCLVSMADPSEPGGQCGVFFTTGDFVVGVGPTGSQDDYAFKQAFNLFVPEPATAALMGAGLLALGAAARRRI